VITLRPKDDKDHTKLWAMRGAAWQTGPYDREIRLRRRATVRYRLIQRKMKRRREIAAAIEELERMVDAARRGIPSRRASAGCVSGRLKGILHAVNRIADEMHLRCQEAAALAEHLATAQSEFLARSQAGRARPWLNEHAKEAAERLRGIVSQAKVARALERLCGGGMCKSGEKEG